MDGEGHDGSEDAIRGEEGHRDLRVLMSMETGALEPNVSSGKQGWVRTGCGCLARDLAPVSPSPSSSDCVSHHSVGDM